MENPLWSQSWRPQTVADCILPVALSNSFQAMVKSGELPNMILSGPAGMGKTSVAMAAVKDLGRDCYKVNGSMEGNIDTLRNDIQSFVSSVAFNGKRKYVVVDEADNMTEACQKGLRAFIEDFGTNAGFILTCNYPERILKELFSRCEHIEFFVPRDERTDLMKRFLRSAVKSLTAEGVEYEPKALAEVLRRWFPDLRKVVNYLQKAAREHGRIDSGAIPSVVDEYKVLIKAMRERDYTSVRAWIGESTTDGRSVVRFFFDHLDDVFDKESIPQAVLYLRECARTLVMGVDQEVCLAAGMAELMVECKMK